MTTGQSVIRYCAIALAVLLSVTIIASVVLSIAGVLSLLGGKRCVKLTLTKQFACFPGDRVQLTAAKLGVSGTFTVISSHCWADSLSAGTIVTLEV